MIKTFKLVVRAEKEDAKEEKMRKEDERKKKLKVLNAAHHNAASFSIKPPPKPPGFEPLNVRQAGFAGGEEGFDGVVTNEDRGGGVSNGYEQRGNIDGQNRGHMVSPSFKRELQKAGYSPRSVMDEDDMGCCSLL